MTNKTQLKNYSKRWKGSQRRIGITGGIASGKSTIGDFLKAEKNSPIPDGDVYYKEVLAPGSIYTKKVINRYGNKIISSNIHNKEIINRSLLSSIIFEEEEERLWLENLIHPIVNIRFLEDLKLYKEYKVVVLIIPLLFETELDHLCSEIWVIDCKFEQQLKRLMIRNKLTFSQAEKRIKAQWPLKKKKILGDFIIDNSGDLDSWQKQLNTII